MKFNTLLSTLTILGTGALVQGTPTGVDITFPKACSNNACTMNLEKVYHVKLFYNRKEGITPEQFNSYWANNHASIATPFHTRIGVVRYSQYHSTPEYRDLLRVPGGLPVLEFDGAAEFWVRDLQTLQAMQTDEEYVNKIQPDEANFIDPKSFKMIIGVDYIVVDNQKAVTEHGRTFESKPSTCPASKQH